MLPSCLPSCFLPKHRCMACLPFPHTVSPLWASAHIFSLPRLVLSWLCSGAPQGQPLIVAGATEKPPLAHPKSGTGCGEPPATWFPVVGDNPGLECPGAEGWTALLALPFCRPQSRMQIPHRQALGPRDLRLDVIFLENYSINASSCPTHPSPPPSEGTTPKPQGSALCHRLGLCFSCEFTNVQVWGSLYLWGRGWNTYCHSPGFPPPAFWHFLCRQRVEHKAVLPLLFFPLPPGGCC